MNATRLLMLCTCMALAACAAPAAQDPSQQLPPPQRVADMTCKVDADCSAKPQCVGTQCRCVQDKCIAKREALDPVIDPAPATSVR
ncbi:hypothetical protein AB4059_11070 [Lysobacter sp. 2RAF19]